ncbi:helix-turn-helix domain-containing protein [Falsihalocynthiibacter sp. BN13B15]|uniref:helix-turn-helix domain-containing protein n=1 Tax=Falsihalocynthiibacter sp. BN13B15 TaxID=3240871 RepID=UPI00351009C4
MPILDKDTDLTVLDVMDRLQISRDKAYDLIKKGDLVSYKIGRSRRIRRDSFEALRVGDVVSV